MFLFFKVHGSNFSVSMAASDPSVEELIARLPTADDQKVLKRLLFGNPVRTLTASSELQQLANAHNFDIALYETPSTALPSDRCPDPATGPRRVRVGVIQAAIVRPTTDPVAEQREALYQAHAPMIHAAGRAGVAVLGLQEAWPCPFFFCTREKHPWMDFAEAVDGPSFAFLSPLAKQYGMAIISPILERDPHHQGTIWNTAVVIDSDGTYLGKHRKNHIPRVGDFNESTYYHEGDTGHPVFHIRRGGDVIKVGVNICYGRHHPLNWLGFALNGAEIVFNPSATVGALSEPLWPIEGRNAAISNNYFVATINRVGTEMFPNEFTSGDGKGAHKDFGHFYGSSYVANPDGSRTPGLSRNRNGLLINEVDLNMCLHVKDKWCFQMTARYPLYAELLHRYIQPTFRPQMITNRERQSNTHHRCDNPTMTSNSDAQGDQYFHSKL